ncbi:hypothetical protein C5F48_19190 [Cereibacter changlensis JA139]|uniref:Uncharacterized protein n=2 Tax=Cereibacter changlensis TaxID=402884 RepID=A0A2T4JQC5_9RHOB|nr:hypothetical protein [Cereibacter changlensis]PTE20121.1 hypothetical protein C5F48_19190 [Cereibacter changlensis JA139]PZX52808.1 hypothetical protein LX76_02438 [Cereibacter changlensis]
MNNPKNLLTSAERHEQLRAIAAAKGGWTVAETLAHLINAEIARGTIPDELPGITIRRVANGVLIALDPESPAVLPLESARALGELVADLADATSRRSGEFNLQHGFMTARRGQAVQVAVPLGGETRNFSRDLARDFARLVLVEVDKAPTANAA